VFLSGVPQLQANGFKKYNLSARAATLGGAFTARADDSSAVYYNPGGLGFFEGLRIKTNLLFNYLTTTAYIPETGQNFKSSPLQYRGSYFATWQFADRLTLGLAGFNPYLTQAEMSWNWPGKPLNMKSDFSAIYVRPALAIRLLENLSLGFGVDFVFARMNWRHGQIFPRLETLTQGWMVDSQYESKGSGIGFAGGALWKIHKRLQFGVRYQHKVKLDLEGKQYILDPSGAQVVEIPSPQEFPMSLTQRMREFRMPQTVTSQITLPAEFAAGLMIVPWDSLVLHMDLCWHGWSEFGDWEYQAADPEADLNQDFFDLYKEVFGIAPAYGRQGLTLGLRDVWSVKFGLEVKLSKVFAIRSGYSFNPSALSNHNVDPINTDLDQHIITVGLGYEGPMFSIWDFEEQGGLSFDVYLQYRMSEEQESSLAGFQYVYDTDRWILGFGVGLNF
jgi:long-subunit fatty acid transport protein